MSKQGIADQEVKTLWLNALRSGEYIQGHGALCRNNSNGPEYCCLGVLCEVLKLPSDKEENDCISYWEKEYKSRSTICIPHSLACRLTIDADVLTDLVRMNDSKNASFKKIANWIEENL